MHCNSLAGFLPSFRILLTSMLLLVGSFFFFFFFHNLISYTVALYTCIQIVMELWMTLSESDYT